MFKKLLLTATLCLVGLPAFAQNPQCPTRPPGDSTNACASTQFVQQAVSSLGLVVGSTAISGGSANQLLYDAGGTLGEIARCNNGVYVSDGGGVPSCAPQVQTSNLPSVSPFQVLGNNGTATAPAAPISARVLLTAPLTLFYRTDGSNSNNGLTNNAGGALADPGFCINYVASHYDRGGQTVTCLNGETTPKTFAPSNAGYTCGVGFTGSGTTVVSGNLNQATVTTPTASPGVVNWAGHGLVAGSPVYFSGGTLPTGLNSTQLFYVIAAGLTANSFEVATSAGGSAVNFTGTSSGTQTGNAITTLIDGTVNTGSGFAINGGGCALKIQNFQIKASINSTSCLAGPAGPGGFFWLNIIWLGTTFGDDVFGGPQCAMTQIGTDWIAGQLGSTAHIQAGHGAEIRCSACTTNISANLTYGTTSSSFVYASFAGRVVYTSSPTINLNGFTVTGQRCYADTNGIVEQAGLGVNFFPGNVACSTATQGLLVQ